MASITVTPVSSSSLSPSSRPGVTRDLAASSKDDGGAGQSLKSALARSITGTLAFYFKRPVRLFRPTRVSAWTAFSEIASSQGHKNVNAGFLRGIISKQGWTFFFREAFPPLLANSLIGFTLFSTYTLTESALRYFPSEPVNPLWIPAISGGVAGAAQAFISSPLDNVRALLAAKPSASKSIAKEWKGWRWIAYRALVPQWLITTTSLRKNPIRFLSNWWRSSWALFTFTLLRDSLGFAVFFSIFEGSRSIAKKVGKAVDRYQADLKAKSEELGINIQELLENDVLPRGWPGRVAQAFIIVSFGVFAGLGYGLVGRPFDKARTVVWNGLEEWAKERRRAAKAEAAQERQAGIGSDSIRAISSESSKAAQHAVPSVVTHRSRHSRLTAHETRLPLHPPRPAEAPKHPLKDPSIMYTGSFAASPSTPSAVAILRQHYKREGPLAILGFSKGQAALLKRAQAVLSRKQAATQSQASKDTPRAEAPVTLQALAEHPALGGTSVFDNLPEPETQDLRTPAHRKARLWRRHKFGGPASGASQHTARWSSRLSVSGIFRVVPPYAVAFLVYAVIAGDLSD